MTEPDATLDNALRTHTDYGVEKLEEADLAGDPFAQFTVWLAEAAEREVYEPNAMVLATIDPDGAPSIRTVLLRGVDDRGFAFYTDYTSRKGRALLANPAASVVFPWYSLHRQVIVFGEARPVEADDSDAYFSARPRGAQVAAWSSDQSQPVASRDDLEQKVRDADARFADSAEIPRPERWGGFRLVPQRVEFWQGRTSRLHDRLVFTRATDDSWRLERLQP
ncbi:MAG: pyridoxamine 5'-phosphate oxidase [Microcella sp.]|nr:pyridoxamine 5'-phosphate oxidase [Microcella sp.]